MKIRVNEDYYQWYCEWCDSENSVLWAKASEEFRCGACHKKQFLAGTEMADTRLRFSAGLRQETRQIQQRYGLGINSLRNN